MVGTTVSHYNILQQLGGGGMGVVYKAQDIRLGRHVALKFLPPNLTRDPEAKERFIHEAKAASALQHDNICGIHDIEESPDGQTFIVLEFCEGETIKKKIAQGPLPVDQALKYAIQVGEGLAEAHRNGIVHRDIKPANVMVTDRGKAKIVDFGVALLSGATRVTTDGRKVGTVTHMSPEQARGEPVDNRSDIWSLGVLLYEMLTGRLPFDSSYEQALVYSILNLNPMPLSSARAHVPQALDQIIQKSLAKSVEERYQNVEEMVADLRELAGPATGSGSSARLSAATPGMRKRTWSLVGVAAVLVIASLGIWLFRGSGHQPVSGTNQVKVQLREVRNETGDARIDDWARLVQESYLPGELLGKKDLVVLDAESQEEGADFQLDGEIIREASSYILQLKLKARETGFLRHIARAPFESPGQLPAASSAVVQSILLFLEIAVLAPDLEAWMPGRALTDSAANAFKRAATYILTGEPGGGVFLDEAIRLDSTFVAPRVWLIPPLVSAGTEHARLEAEAHYRVLGSLMSRVTPFELSMIELAGCYLEADLPCRVAALEKGLRFSPGNRIILENLGTQYYRLERYEEAAASYEPLIRSGMSYPPVYPEYARVLIRRKQFDRARTVLDSALALLPVDPDTYALLAAFAWKDGDSARAKTYELNLMQGLERRKRPTTSPFEVLGRTLVDLEEPYLALRFLQMAASENSDASSPHCALARALYFVGDTAGADSEANAALAHSDSCVEAHLLIGNICERRGEMNFARTHYQKYLQIDSVTVTARELQRKLMTMEVAVKN